MSTTTSSRAKQPPVDMPLAIVIATMASLSTVLLGMGQRDLLLPSLTMLAATASVTLNDWLRWFRLNRILANIAMLLAAIFSLNGFLGSSSHEQLQAIARLLTYVQIVLMFQEKNVRIFGQLIMFSLLQVVVASLLNDSLEFGLLLLLYLAFAVAGIALFFVYREVDRAGVIQPRRRWLAWDAGRSRRAEQLAVTRAAPQLEMLDTSVSLQTALLTRQFATPLLGLGAAMLVFATVFFYSTPRTGGANWESGAGARSVVGFSPEISFEGMGKLLQNDTRVMRVSFLNAKSDAIYTVVGEPYFRGTVLTKYLTSGGQGQWRQEVESSATAGLPLGTPPDTRELVRQEVLLEPTGDPQLFSLFPIYGIAETPESLRLGARTHRLHRVGFSYRELRDEFRYSVVTTAFRFGAQYLVAPESNRLQTPQDRTQLERLKMRLQFLDSREQFPGLIRQAEEIVRDKAPQGSSYEKARALESHFLEASRYTYTIDFDDINRSRDVRLDPVEDFVLHHHKGHCEFFASALTLMLRSQGIPARMVVGYKGGEYNYVGNYFVVRQRDAHAWVEAYVPTAEIPLDAMCPEERHAGGGWLRLDPTPSSDAEEKIAEHGVFDRVSKSFDYARWLWNDYVLRLTAGRQETSILRPLALDRELPLGELVSPEALRSLADKAMGVKQAAGSSGYSLQGAVAALLVCALLFALYKLARRLQPLRLWPRPRGHAAAARLSTRRRIVTFYQRLELLLSGRLGLHRRPAQTQREFARLAAAQLAANPEHRGVVDVPESIARAFYQVRFSDWVPSAQQDAAITADLDRLEQQIGGRPAHRADPTRNGPAHTDAV